MSQITPEHNWPQVSFLELLLDFAYSTGSWPPVKIRQDGRQHSYFFAHVHMDQPVVPTYSEALATFDDSILLLSRLHGHELLPGLRGTETDGIFKRRHINVIRIQNKAFRTVALPHAPKWLNELKVKQHLSSLRRIFPWIQGIANAQVEFLCHCSQPSMTWPDLHCPLPNRVAYNMQRWRAGRAATAAGSTFRAYSSSFSEAAFC